MNAFANGEDIYCASASKMFGVPVIKHGVNGHLRQKGKCAELSCGYGGSVGAMKAFGADAMGLSDNELKQIVTDWRKASPNIVQPGGTWRGQLSRQSAAKRRQKHTVSNSAMNQDFYLLNSRPADGLPMQSHVLKRTVLAVNLLPMTVSVHQRNGNVWRHTPASSWKTSFRV